MASPDPYAAIAAFYDAEFAGACADVAYYARRGVPGPLLVLGCGTGRVCTGLEDTRPVSGLDASAAMLARAPIGRTRWVLGDMRDFDLGPFAEVIVPNAAFSFLHARADQLACLGAIHRSLPPGAPLTLDLPYPDLRLLAEPHSPERPAWAGRIGDRDARRTREVFRRAVEARIDLVDRYHLDGVLVATSVLELQLAFPREIEWMLEAAGFYVDALHGDHTGGGLRDGCDRLIVRAVRC